MRLSGILENFFLYPTTDILSGYWGGSAKKLLTRQRTFIQRLVPIGKEIFEKVPLPLNGHFSSVWRPCRNNNFEEEISLPDNGQFLSKIQRGHEKKFALHPQTDIFEAKNKCLPEIFSSTRQRTLFIQMVTLDRKFFGR